MATAVISHANSFLKLKFFICGFLVDCLIKKSPGSRSYGMQPGTFVVRPGTAPGAWSFDFTKGHQYPSVTHHHP